tara:strand:- start:77 stop:760 length:684 start_codon:yes stop_codon:yes gene_type:complete
MTFTLVSTDRGLIRCASISAVQAERMKDLYFELEETSERVGKEDREIEVELEVAQASKEELEALKEWNHAEQEAADVAEYGAPWWIPTYWDTTISEDDFQDWYIPILEEMEVSSDGDEWAEDVEQLRLTLKRPFGTGTDIFQQKTNYTMPLSCKVVKKGPNYWTALAENGLGKIYIPRNIIPRYFIPDSICCAGVHVPPLTAEVVFMGFRDCREGKMPWKAISIDRE